MIVTPTILADKEVLELADMASAIEAVTRAFKARTSGALIAPPRHSVTFPELGNLVFTIGGVAGDAALAGFRVYDTFETGGAPHTQIVAIWNARSGSLQGLILGERLGDLRTGAIGGLAIRHMARPDADTLGLIGSGAQARTQIAAAAAVRRLRTVKVHSRNAENRRAFAVEMGRQLDLDITPVASAREAVVGADIVICATSSDVPVIEAAWLAPGAHVNTLGPKTRDRHELGVEVAERAGIIATDSPAQTRAYDAPFFLEGSPALARMVDLADVVAGKVVARPSADAITLFCSVGLAGTEVLVGAAILEEWHRRR
jgi:ornithine cyclodeaminase/alanine dehydrogenase-like protein (mu-crystallin family)